MLILAAKSKGDIGCTASLVLEHEFLQYRHPISVPCCCKSSTIHSINFDQAGN